MQLRIGEFARLAQVSVQTLRYYDTINLLKPGLVDRFTNYRYYELDQLSRLNKILAYKDLGFPLEQIALFMDENPSTADLHKLLELRRKELNAEIESQLERLERIDARLSILDSEANLPSSGIILKKIQPVRVVSLRGVIPSYWQVSPLWEKLYEIIAEKQLKTGEPNLTLFHAADPEIEVEVCTPLLCGASSGEEAPYQNDLPGYETAACYVHHGTFNGISSVFASLVRWIDLNNYSIIGPDREVYLRLPDQCRFDSDPNAITELQVPVLRKSAPGVK